MRLRIFAVVIGVQILIGHMYFYIFVILINRNTDVFSMHMNRAIHASCGFVMSRSDSVLEQSPDWSERRFVACDMVTYSSKQYGYVLILFFKIAS